MMSSAMSTEPSKSSKSSPRAGGTPAGNSARLPASVARSQAAAAAARAEAAAARAEAAEAKAAAEEALAAAEEATGTGSSAASAEAAPPVPSWVRRLAALGAIALGWGFIAWHNHFYFTAPVVILALGWAAAISTLYFLWRVGAAGADPEVAREDWWRVIGEREELEREKRSLLKTIREIEFDHQTGKLSSVDAQEMIQVVRGRAIEVMKAIDALSEGEGDARSEIEREVRARLEVEKAVKAGKKAKGVVSKDAVSKAAATHKAEAKAARAKASAAEAKASAAEAAASAAEREAKDEEARAAATAEPEAAEPEAAEPEARAAAPGARSATAINVSAAADLDEARPLDVPSAGDAGPAAVADAGDAASPSSAPTERKSPEVSA
jgi:hypothetical protein